MSQNIEYDVIDGDVEGVEVLDDIFLDIDPPNGIWKRKIIVYQGQVYGIDYLLSVDKEVLEVTHKFPMKRMRVILEEYYKEQDDEGVTAG